MQLSVFSTDNQKSGFRLQYMEVFNWGTFDGQVYKIHPQGETSLLTGSNGSGKTTFVDALLTLIVPEKKYRFYNQSSGSEKKGDRTEDSYVLGGYGSINNETTGVTRTLYLRENKEEAYSILLAHFANEADQYVTLFQVRYFANGDMRKIFGIGHKPLHIEEDFKPFDLGGQWKKNIDQRYNKGSRKQVEWFDAASRYARRLVDTLGMQSLQSLQLFNQTVGIKVLGNLDEFIRLHMLEPRNVEDNFQDLKKNLGTLLDAQRNIEKTEQQISLLQPVQQHYQQFTLLQQSIEQLQQELQTATAWNSYTKDHLLQDALEESRQHQQLLVQKRDSARESAEALNEQERQTRNQIDQNKAGQRMQQLEKDLQDHNRQLKKTEEDRTLFTDWCNILHLPEKEAAEENTYQRILKESNRAGLRLDREKRLNDDDEFDARNTQSKATIEKEYLEEELNNLLQQKNNIPVHLVNLRKEICAALKTDPSELPFAGELMQVKTEEMHWQPALEKLLHSFSLRLLVPDKYYKKVNRYVNNNNLRTRLVYNHVTDTPLLQHADPDTVYEKLDFHPDHKLSAWVEQQVIQQFNYCCLEDEKTIDRYDRAITLNGLIKNRQRHEKDDRPDKNDPGRYVMGWNNEKKKEALIQKRNKLSDALQLAVETLERCKNKDKRLQQQYYALTRMQEHPGFAAIDVAGVQQTIRKTEEQIEGLRKANKELDTLKKQLQDIQEQKAAANKTYEDLLREETRLQAAEENLAQQQMALQPFLQHLLEADKDLLLQFQQQHAALLSNVALDTIDELYRQLKDKKETALETQKEQLHREETQVNRFIQKIKNPSAELLQKYPDWLGDVQGFSEEATYAVEYIEWLNKLQEDNLPRYKKKFEEYVNETITYKIGGLNEELEKWERDINNSIVKLNQSLGGINFNRYPDTYIQLGKRAAASGSEVKEFRSRLLDALPQAANWQQSSFEEKALHFRQKVQPLIGDLDQNENYRNRVMDVRNWFEFWADEKFRNTNELKKTYRQMGQLSGGEKAQLTYTILCSAIAYQFGITREGKNSRSLRFIAVDESFSNQDEEKATYLMELCKQLHLQLLVVTPSDKIQIVQEFIAHVHLVQRVNNRHSVLYNMTIKELKEKISDELILTES